MTIPIEDLRWAAGTVDELTDHFDAVVVGQPRLRTALMACMLARGHALLESVPGLAKTLATSTLARAVDGSFARIQCTPDLLPSDIIGTQIYDAGTATFSTELGPVHANFVLLDEINRSSAKTQSAMLEAMQERQTSVAGETFPLPDPFMVMATQNPIEEEGTYVLPQAQMDRFLLKEVVDYPAPEDELRVLERIETGEFDVARPAVCTTDNVRRLQALTAQVRVDTAIKRYLVELVTVTREPSRFLESRDARWIEYGASPRGSIALLQVSRALALMAGRDHVVPDDVVALRHAVLRHRIVLTFEAVAERIQPESIVDAVFAAVPTP